MFKLNFDDGSSFEGDSFNGSWATAPDKRIKSMEYLYDNKRYLFSGFKQYIHLVQHDSMGGVDRVRNVYLVGREENRSIILWFYLPAKRVIRIITPIGKEVCLESGGKVRVEEGILNGWKDGLYDRPRIDKV